MLARSAWRHGQAGADVLRRIERSVCGCDYGGTSWTTAEEAMDIAGVLALAPGVRLLEIGAGTGWPGLFLAQETGCEVMLIDLPPTGLELARRRAEADGLSHRCQVAAADAAWMPFRDGEFDALVHSDVLCCLPEKLAVLQECRRVLAPGGRMVFSVIAVSPGLPPDDHAQGEAAGPPFIGSPAAYPDLLREAGWKVAMRTDFTARYMQRIRTTLREQEANAADLIALRGEEDVAQSRARHSATLAALERGLITREVFEVTPS